MAARVLPELVGPRSQSGAAVSADGQSWYLVNASPDVPRQIGRHLGAFQAQPDKKALPRTSPVAGVFLTDAGIDHALGLVLLREGERLRVWAPRGVRDSLCGPLGVGRVLDAFCGVDWVEARAGEPIPIAGGEIEARLVPVPGSGPPPYDAGADRSLLHGCGWVFRDTRNCRRVGIFPDVGSLDANLASELQECDAIYFDGTFWSDDEMARAGISERTAADMGHLPIGGAGGGAEVLRQMPAATRAFFHINNTNPCLVPGSPEHAAIEAMGLRLAVDGEEIEI